MPSSSPKGIPFGHARREWLLVAISSAIYAAILALTLGRGVSSDEVATLQIGSLRAIFFDPQSATNPPLQRLLVNLVREESAIFVGRLISLGAAAGALPVAFALGRRVSGSALGGFVSLALVATNAILFEHATLVQSHAPWLLVALWHAYALYRVIDDEQPSPFARASLALSSLLLPWLHYLSIPLLVIEAILVALSNRERLRNILVLVVTPALISIPVFVPLLRDGSRREPGDWHRLGGSAIDFLSAGWTAAAFVIVPWLVAFAIVSKPPAHGSRALTLATLAAFAAIFLAIPFVRLRTPAAIFAVPFLVPLLAASVAARGWFGRASIGAAALIATGGIVGIVLSRSPQPRDRVADFARGFEKWAADHRGGPILVNPSAQVTNLHYELTREPIQSAKPSSCATGTTCFEHKGVIVIGVDRLAPPPHGFVVSFEEEPPGALRSACKLLESRSYFFAFEC